MKFPRFELLRFKRASLAYRAEKNYWIELGVDLVSEPRGRRREVAMPISVGDARR